MNTNFKVMIMSLVVLILAAFAVYFTDAPEYKQMATLIAGIAFGFSRGYKYGQRLEGKNEL